MLKIHSRERNIFILHNSMRHLINGLGKKKDMFTEPNIMDVFILNVDETTQTTARKAR